MLPPRAMTPRATVLIPTHDHGATLLYSTRSALAQTVREIEVFIVGDGMSPDTTLAADELEHADTRVRVFRYPKGPRHGEIHRHSALAEASGAIVCYLSDDDLWLPNHVEVMEELLRVADFAHTLGIRVQPDGRLRVGNKVDFGMPGIRDRSSHPDCVWAARACRRWHTRWPCIGGCRSVGTPPLPAHPRKSPCPASSSSNPSVGLRAARRRPSSASRHLGVETGPLRATRELSAWSTADRERAMARTAAVAGPRRGGSRRCGEVRPMKALKHAHLRKRRAFRKKLQAERERVTKLRALLDKYASATREQE